MVFNTHHMVTDETIHFWLLVWISFCVSLFLFLYTIHSCAKKGTVHSLLWCTFWLNFIMISIVLAKFYVWEGLGDVQLVQSANFWLLRIRINRRSTHKLGQFQRDQMNRKSRFLRIKKTELEASSLTWEPCPRWLRLHLWPVLTASSLAKLRVPVASLKQLGRGFSILVGLSFSLLFSSFPTFKEGHSTVLRSCRTGSCSASFCNLYTVSIGLPKIAKPVCYRVNTEHRALGQGWPEERVISFRRRWRRQS